MAKIQIFRAQIGRPNMPMNESDVPVLCDIFSQFGDPQPSVAASVRNPGYFYVRALVFERIAAGLRKSLGQYDLRDASCSDDMDAILDLHYDKMKGRNLPVIALGARQ